MTQSNEKLYLLPFIIIIVLTFVTLVKVLKHRLKRYYLTDQGIVILNLFTSKHFIISTDKILGYSYRESYNDSPSYLVGTSQLNISFSVRQIKSIEQFKNYFKKHNIQYYEYDWLTGNDYKK